MRRVLKLLDQALARPKCPNCSERSDQVKGEKAVCARCGNVWNWKKALGMRVVA